MTVTVKNPACADAINHRPPERHDGQIKESHDKPPLRQTPHPRDVPLSNSGGNRQAQTFFHLRGWEIKSDGMIGWATYSSLTPILTPILTILRPQYLPDPNTYQYLQYLYAAAPGSKNQSLDLGSATRSAPTYGLGGVYSVSPSVGIRFGWDRYGAASRDSNDGVNFFSTNYNVDVYSLGVPWAPCSSSDPVHPGKQTGPRGPVCLEPRGCPTMRQHDPPLP
jgi:hypothetical protein